MKHTYRAGRLANWYEQNYTYMKELWPTWLSDSLLQMMEPECKYHILSPSANQGWHEKDAWKQLIAQGYQSSWILADLHGGYFYQNQKDEDGFQYHREDCAAQTFCQGQYDIILDNKGALWYALRGIFGKYRAKQLFAHYANLLKEEQSILLVDGYAHSKFSHLENLWRFRRGDQEMNHFQENSTYYELTKTLPKIAHLMHSISCKGLSERQCASIRKMDLHYLTKRELKSLLYAY